nr:phosphate signaling complex protein PhoU [uncultured Holophaga sp.]
MRHFDNELRDLKFSLLAMAGLVEEMVDLSRKAFTERSDARADQVIALDQNVDELELSLDHTCIDLLALRAPYASDLRLLASTLKIIPELERIGDHCVNVARRVKFISAYPHILTAPQIEELSAITQAMVKKAINAFVNGDASAAREVIAEDDRVDELYVQVSKDMMQIMLQDPTAIERASHLIILVKNWERIADQATNIAEEVLFILDGVNVKHAYLQRRES